MNGTTDAIVIGGGISGLTVAYSLQLAGVNVIVLEKEDGAGGTMKTVHENGWLMETGPNSALETTPVLGSMIARLGLESEFLYADPSSNRRYILRGGRLHPLPMSPPAFLASRLWTLRGKLRLLKEPFIGRAVEEETVAQFVERRLGKEFLDYAIDPFVAGVFAGSPSHLSVRSAFPRLYALEEQYGGLIAGMIRGARERARNPEKAKDRARMFSFRNGMQVLPDALARSLGDRFRPDCEARHIERHPDTGFRVTGRERGTDTAWHARIVVLAVPSEASERFMRPFDASAADAVSRIPYPPVAEVFLGYRSGFMTRPLDGFGFLVPALEQRKILGTIWSSALFPGRAPDGHVALTSFVGGSRQPELVGNDDAGLIDLVAGELGALMGVRGEPVFARVSRWDRAIPQYHIGHGRIMEAVDRLELHAPGLFVCSNFRDGISVGDCVKNAAALAERIAGMVKLQSERTTHEVP
jgi:oxygen-dependent protoporphyrinogen oxidase